MDRRRFLMGSLGAGLISASNTPGRRDALAGTQVPQRRIALVLANEAYQKNPLQNVRADAVAMESSLKTLGFEVLVGLDLNRSGMFAKLRAFREKITPGCVAVFYFSGHGAQVDGENYLIPIDNRELQESSDLQDESLPLSRVFDSMGRSDGQLNIVVLEACRDNPFTGAKSFGDGKGLAVVQRNAVGTLVAFAAGPGAVVPAKQGDRGSLFTEELARNIVLPGVRLEDVFLATRKAVRTRSGGKQVPEEYGSLESIVYLAGQLKAPAPQGVRTVSGQEVPKGAVRLDLNGVPPGAKVLVNGNELEGTTFVSQVEGATEEVEIAISAVGYRPYVRMVSLPKGKAVALDVELAYRAEPGAVPMRARIGLQAQQFPENLRYIQGLRLVPAGTLPLGATAFSAERPVHVVTVTTYRLGATPVTVAMWKEYCKATGRPMPEAPPWGWIDSHPVVNVSWNDIVATEGVLGFLPWIVAVSALPFALPTEAQWEFAARAGRAGRDYPWGTSFDRAKLWCSAEDNGDIGRTAPVVRPDRIHRNEFGLTDLAGNVWEWCSDWKSAYPAAPTKDPVGLGGSVEKVYRGGGWDASVGDFFRCAFREGGFPDYSAPNLGFRLALRESA